MTEKDDRVHYVANGHPPPKGVGLCGASPVATSWKLAQVTCEACERKFSEDLFALRAEMARHKFR